MNEFDEDVMERMGLLAQSAYTPTKQKRQRDVDARYNGEYSLVDNYSDKEHSVYLNNKDNSLIVAIAGTDFSNSAGRRLTDLGNDVLVGFGLEKFGNRYKKADKLVSGLIRDFPDKKIVLTAHSLGSTIGTALGYRYDLESHNFAAGATPMSNSVKQHKVLHPDTKRKKDKTHHYLVKPSMEGTGIDLISISNAFNPLHTVHWVDPKKLKRGETGLLFHHSTSHFIGRSEEM